MNRKQRKAKRLRATQHTKSFKSVAPLQVVIDKKNEQSNAESFKRLFDKNKELHDLSQKKQRNVGIGTMAICSIAMIWLVVEWIK